MKRSAKAAGSLILVSKTTKNDIAQVSRILKRVDDELRNDLLTAISKRLEGTRAMAGLFNLMLGLSHSSEDIEWAELKRLQLICKHEKTKKKVDVLHSKREQLRWLHHLRV